MVAARGWKGEVNLRSVLGLAWVVERGREGRKGRLGSSVGQQAQWWAVWVLVGLAVTEQQSSLASTRDSPAHLNGGWLAEWPQLS